MKKLVKPTSLIFIICLIILVGFGIYEYFSQSQMVKSASSSNVSGWAWSSNIGWVSFGSDDYGVNMGSDGNFYGYALSENIGWISFNRNETGAPPSNDPCPDASCIAKVERPKRLGKEDIAVLGWARALAACQNNLWDGTKCTGSGAGDASGGWDGWIRFDHGKDDEIYINEEGHFRGRAWGGDVIGWITFNDVDDSESYSFTCGTEGGDICQNNEFCPIAGKTLDITGTSDCCSVECILQSCAEQGGDICQGLEECTGTPKTARGTDRCCSAGDCVVPYIPPTLEDCLGDCTEAFQACWTGCIEECPGAPIVYGASSWLVIIGDEGCIEDCQEDCGFERDYCIAGCEDEYCGNCVEDSGGAYPFYSEECDDCNASNTDACLGNCIDASCGDGHKWSGVEQCDDGNSINTDACLNDCTNATCGDNYVRSGVEQCDDGNNNNGDGCDANCDIEHTYETCLDDCWDDRNSCEQECPGPIAYGASPWLVIIGDPECIADCGADYLLCQAACKNLYCGNGVVDSGEQCDDGNTSNTDACLNDCTNATCGDGHRWSGVEQCDDGNTSNTDACPNTCNNATCGDGYRWSGQEECDDGNNNNGDGCSSTCTIEHTLESCLDTCQGLSLSERIACRQSCRNLYCGNCVVDSGGAYPAFNEQCDDCNTSNTDACLTTCRNATCGDGYRQSGVEQCDDGDSDNYDSCLNNCNNATCGDGYRWSGQEQCDDGNNNNGDGCSSTCTLELESCADQGGDICTAYEYCPGTYIPASDTNDCCSVKCKIEEEPLCFTGKTPILMADATYKNIADVQLGEYILTRESEISSKLVPAKVLDKYEHWTNKHLVINNSLEVTSEHRMFINGKWKLAGDIKIGDKLLSKDNQEVIVESIEQRTKELEFQVYNLEIEKYQTYFAEEFYVHNIKYEPEF